MNKLFPIFSLFGILNFVKWNHSNNRLRLCMYFPFKHIMLEIIVLWKYDHHDVYRFIDIVVSWWNCKARRMCQGCYKIGIITINVKWSGQILFVICGWKYVLVRQHYHIEARFYILFIACICYPFFLFFLCFLNI